MEDDQPFLDDIGELRLAYPADNEAPSTSEVFVPAGFEIGWLKVEVVSMPFNNGVAIFHPLLLLG